MKRRYKNKTGIGIISFVVMLLFSIVAYNKIGLERQNEQAKLQIKKINAQIEEQKERKSEINELKAYVQTKKYIEDTAREKLGMVYKDEIVLQPEK